MVAEAKKAQVGSLGEYNLSVDDTGRCCLYPLYRPGSTVPPPSRSGPRETDYLSDNAVRTIRAAARKARHQGRPFRVMWTPSVAERLGVNRRGKLGPLANPREAVANGEVILSREMRRFINAFRARLRYLGDTRPFEVVWVAENPPSGSEDERDPWGKVRENSRNPHVHMLLGWTWECEKRKGEGKAAFERRKAEEWLEFAASVERLWGLGTCHMEFLRNDDDAVGYILKALGYVTKGADRDREPEPLPGQRWGVSRSLRVTKEVSPVEFGWDEAGRLYALRCLAEEGPLRFGKDLTVSKWALSGYGLSPEEFVAKVRWAASDGYYFDESFGPDAQALARADAELGRESRVEAEWEAYQARQASLEAWRRVRSGEWSLSVWSGPWALVPGSGAQAVYGPSGEALAAVAPGAPSEWLPPEGPDPSSLVPV